MVRKPSPGTPGARTIWEAVEVRMPYEELALMDEFAALLGTDRSVAVRRALSDVYKQVAQQYTSSRRGTGR